MKNVLWFSRHVMTIGQMTELRNVFGDIKINQISYPIDHAKEIKRDIENNDIIALVAPLKIQQQFLELAGDKPVLFCRNHRDHKGPNGYRHGGWFRIKKLDCEFEPLTGDNYE